MEPGPNPSQPEALLTGPPTRRLCTCSVNKFIIMNLPDTFEEESTKGWL
jgi:hypothetical protein